MAIAGVGKAREVQTISNNVVTLIKTLTASEALAKQFTLAIEPTDPNLVILDLIGGTPQANGSDFEVIGAVFSWNGKTLETVLAENDIIRVSYPI